jgi:anti-sigma factor RsiW
MADFEQPRMSGPHLDAGEIHAWLDGALSPEETARVESHVAECPTCREAVAEARGFIAASSRILSALDAVPAGVVPATPRVRPAGRPRRVVSWPVRAAAAAVVVAVGIAVVARRVPERMTDRVSAPAPTPLVAPALPSAPSAAPAPAKPAPAVHSRPASSPQAKVSAEASRSRVWSGRGVTGGAAKVVAPAPVAASDAAVSEKGHSVGVAAGTGPVPTMQSVRAALASPAIAGARGSAGTVHLLAPACDSAVRKLAADSVMLSALPLDSVVRRDSIAQADSALRRCP